MALAKKKKADLIKGCNHQLPKTDRKRDSDYKTERLSYNASCVICGSYFGHLCLESPDSVCHYYSNNGQVELIDGTHVQVPEDHCETFETDDCCIFCGQPEERK